MPRREAGGFSSESGGIIRRPCWIEPDQREQRLRAFAVPELQRGRAADRETFHAPARRPVGTVPVEVAQISLEARGAIAPAIRIAERGEHFARTKRQNFR